jgi:hypothetical protein
MAPIRWRTVASFMGSAPLVVGLEADAAHDRFPFMSKRVGFPAAISFSSASP